MSTPAWQPVLDFWFGELNGEGLADESHARRWFVKDEAFDEELRTRFQTLHQAILDGRCQDWLDEPRGRLAYVLVLDQFSRNLFRGSERMFAYDELALTIARQALAEGD